MIYVTDTHPLVFWSSNRKSRLGKRARRILQETEQGKHSIIVPIIVLEEINRLAERNLVRLNVPFRRWAEELERSPNFPARQGNAIQLDSRSQGWLHGLKVVAVTQAVWRIMRRVAYLLPEKKWGGKLLQLRIISHEDNVTGRN